MLIDEVYFGMKTYIVEEYVTKEVVNTYHIVAASEDEAKNALQSGDRLPDLVDEEVTDCYDIDPPEVVGEVI